MNYIVIGGGLAGLMAARRLRVDHPRAAVTVIERNPELGGLLGGSMYSDPGLYFDQGTHIFQETGDPALDGFLLDAVSERDLLHFPVGEGDFAGVVFGGRLQSNTHFPDIRDRTDARALTASLEAHVAGVAAIPAVDRTGPLLDTATARFGSAITEQVIGPTLERAYGQPAASLAGFSMLLPGWTRVVAHDHGEWLRHSDDDRYRAVFGVPDQRDLPSERRHPRRSYYARRNGSRAFIDGAAAALERDGVRIMRGATIMGLDLDARWLEVIDADGTEAPMTADGIVIATGVVGAAHLLGVDLAAFGFERPMPHWIINVVVDEPVDSDLCYLYGLDEGVDFYRVTNYRAFAGDPADRRLSIEVLGRRELPAGFPEQLTRQLTDCGLLRSPGIAFSDVRKLGAGFPLPTVTTMRALTALGAHLNERLPERVLLGGIGANEGLFFQNEVVEDIFRRTGALA